MEFMKMQGVGNDFILIDGDDNSDFINNTVNIESRVKKLCDRHFGIGADGLMFSELSEIADIKMNYFNSDGSIAELCGNGIRCFAKFVYETGKINKREFSIETLAGIKNVSLNFLNNVIDTVSVNIGQPVFDFERIPVIIDKEQKKEMFAICISINEMQYSIYVLKVGGPHTVLFIDGIDDVDINSLGKEIENHKIFPQKTNVNFVKVKNKNSIELYTWERGSGRTLACGTGACASVVVGVKRKILNNTVTVYTNGGQLNVSVKDDGIYLTGEAKTVFKGFIA